MSELTEELRRLRENDPDIALILDKFGEINRVYCGSLEAMGSVRKHVSTVRSSADVTYSINPMPLRYGD